MQFHDIFFNKPGNVGCFSSFRMVIQDHTQMLVLVAQWSNYRYFFPSSLFLCLAVDVNVFNNLPIKIKSYIPLLKKKKIIQDWEGRGESSIKIIRV